jgi:hypothetical protein
VSTNYSKCNENAKQLIALQEEVKAYQAKIADLNVKLKGK